MNPEPGKIWVNIFETNRLSVEGMSLSCVNSAIKHGEKVIQLNK